MAGEALRSLLERFNRLEEEPFLRALGEVVAAERAAAAAEFAVLLGAAEISVQLKYLLLKGIQSFPGDDFLPAVERTLASETRARLILESLTALWRIGSIPAYKSLARFAASPSAAPLAERVQEARRQFLERHPLVYHFDVFFRRRAEVKNPESSANYLAEHLADEYFRDILPAVESPEESLAAAALLLLRRRPQPAVLPFVVRFFRTRAAALAPLLFRRAAETLTTLARSSPIRDAVFSGLSEMLPRLDEEKRRLLSILLLQLDTAAQMAVLAQHYDGFSLEEKLLFLDSFDLDQAPRFLDFARRLLRSEDHPDLLRRIVRWLEAGRDWEHFFRQAAAATPARRKCLLGLVLENSPAGIAAFLTPYLEHPDDDALLLSVVEYILEHEANSHFDSLFRILHGGAGDDVKDRIAARVGVFSAENGQRIIRSLVEERRGGAAAARRALYTILRFREMVQADPKWEEWLLDRILVRMEEAESEALVHYVHFFDKYRFPRPEQTALIVAELKLIQNTLLRSSDPQQLVKTIHLLIHRLERPRGSGAAGAGAQA